MWVAQLCSRRAVLDGELVLTSAHRHAVPLPALCARHAVQDGELALTSARCAFASSVCTLCRPGRRAGAHLCTQTRCAFASSVCTPCRPGRRAGAHLCTLCLSQVRVHAMPSRTAGTALSAGRVGGPGMPHVTVLAARVRPSRTASLYANMSPGSAKSRASWTMLSQSSKNDLSHSNSRLNTHFTEDHI